MALLLIEHSVQDFDAWKQIFDQDPVGRERHGVRRYSIYRPVDDPEYVVVSLEFSSPDVASQFVKEPALREAWKRAGVEPKARILDEVEAVAY